MYDSLEECQNASYYKKKENRENLYVLGIADGKDEALEVVRTIIDEVYTNTGSFNISGYLHFGDRRA